jgi:dihydroorotate dehydrogenase
MDWRSAAYAIVRPVLFRFEPERIHRVTLDALRIAGGNPLGRATAAFMGGVRRQPQSVTIAGVTFRNRIGVGAGFDKDGIALPGWAALGLGFAEVGTVTPIGQAGNPRPRLFRLAADGALINRLGFNNGGAAAAARNVMLARHRLPAGFVVGVNVSCNRDTPPERVIDDFCAAHRQVAPVADYVVINVSSPNTPGLRDLQDPERLAALLTALGALHDTLASPPPLFVKLAPDLDDAARDALLTRLAELPAAGVILSNSTTRREALLSPPALSEEAGGLSGDPLLPRTVAAVSRARELVGDRLAIIASGGVRRAEDVALVRDAGADLVQLWTGLVYRGPGLIGEAVASG